MIHPTVEDLCRRHRAYYEILGQFEQRPWGSIGCNLEIPSWPDSNHAYLIEQAGPGRLREILDAVRERYRALGVVPRLWFHSPPHGPWLVQAGEKLGWQSSSRQQNWRIWVASCPAIRAAEVAGLTVSRVGTEARGSVQAVQTAPKASVEPGATLRRRRVWEALLRDPRAECWLARMEGVPAARLACVWTGNWGVVENVFTADRFRRRGICSALSGAVQQDAQARGASGLLLCSVEEGPDRLYARLGFDLRGSTTQLELSLVNAAEEF